MRLLVHTLGTVASKGHTSRWVRVLYGPAYCCVYKGSLLCARFTAYFLSALCGFQNYRSVGLGGVVGNPTNGTSPSPLSFTGKVLMPHGRGPSAKTPVQNMQVCRPRARSPKAKSWQRPESFVKPSPHMLPRPCRDVLRVHDQPR